MRPFRAISLVALLTAGVAVTHGMGGEEPTSASPICDTTFDPVPGGSWMDADNWTNGLPAPDRVACVPDEVGELQLPGRVVRVAARRTTPITTPAHIRPIVPARAAHRRSGNNGRVAGAEGGSIVYSNETDPILAIRAPSAGERMADDLLLASWPARVLSYDLAVFGLGESGEPTFDVSVALWDGDPCVAGSSVIPGSGADFVALPNDGLTVWFLEVVLPTPSAVPTAVWLAATFSTDDSGWVVAEQAETGFTFDRWSEVDESLGCVLFSFSDDLYGGFWANVSAELGGNPVGSCCVGSTCLLTDALDFKVQDGYFLEGVGPCNGFVCATGACCVGDPPACVGDDGAGGGMDQSLCAILRGDYLGGAVCDETDPCQRFRIPEGFEIIEITPGMDSLRRRGPHLNNCGELVFHLDLETQFGLRSDVFLYDNGLLTAVTNSDEVSDIFPDINDKGTIVWGRGAPPVGSEIAMLRRGSISVLGSALGPLSPRLNNRDHVVWRLEISPSCPDPRRDAIQFYDGASTRILFDDGLSNQSATINDHDHVAWTSYDSPCGGGFGDWTSSIMLYADDVFTALPSAVDTPQGPTIDNIGRVAWGSFDLVEIWEDGITGPLTDGHIAALNDRGDVAFQRWMPGWQLWLYRNGVFYPISKPEDFGVPPYIDNGRAALNDADEIAWKWNPNGLLLPSGIRLMRRIRDGDVNFDGVVDIDDFIPLPGCFTGPVATDGLCECRFFDMDHDRDVDRDDFDLFMRVYSGPVSDCNNNGTPDVQDLIDGALDGTMTDCNLNGAPDSCDIADGLVTDGDADAVPDECCFGGVTQLDVLGPKNRFLSFTAQASVPQSLEHDPVTLHWTTPFGFTYIRHAPTSPYAIRVTFLDAPTASKETWGPLPGGMGKRQPERHPQGVTPHSTFDIRHSTFTRHPPGMTLQRDVLAGQVMWVGEPREVCENAGQGPGTLPEECAAALGSGSKTFLAAPLVCNASQAHWADWSQYARVHIYHEALVPGGTYELATINAGCATAFDGNYSAPLTATTARWGDVVKDCTTDPCGPPNGTVNIIDVTAVLDKFRNLAGAPIKARRDLAGFPPNDGQLDLVISILDVTWDLNAFVGGAYIFPPGDPCP